MGTTDVIERRKASKGGVNGVPSSTQYGTEAYRDNEDGDDENHPVTNRQVRLKCVLGSLFRYRGRGLTDPFFRLTGVRSLRT